MLMMMIAEVKKMIIDHYDRLKWNHLALSIENMLHYYGWIVSKSLFCRIPTKRRGPAREVHALPKSPLSVVATQQENKQGMGNNKSPLSMVTTQQETEQGMGNKHAEHKMGLPQSHRAASPGGSHAGRHEAVGGGHPGFVGGEGSYGGYGDYTGGHRGYSGGGGHGGYQGGHGQHVGGPGQHGGGHGQHGGGQRSLLQKPQGSVLSQLQGRVRRHQGGDLSLTIEYSPYIPHSV